MNTLWQGLVTGVSAAYTVGSSDRFIDADATATPFNITLPLLSSSRAVIGREITITKVDVSTNAVTVACAGTDIFAGGAASQAIATQWDYLKLRVTKDAAGNKVWRYKLGSILKPIPAVVKVSAAYTVAASDRFVDVDASLAAITVTLPSLASAAAPIGREISVTVVAAAATPYNVTIACSGTDTFLNGAASEATSALGSILKVVVSKNSAGTKVWRGE